MAALHPVQCSRLLAGISLYESRFALFGPMPYMMVMASPKDKTGKTLPAAAERALAEAETRRRALVATEPPKEIGGPKGPEPTRFGDWEIMGIASDF